MPKKRMEQVGQAIDDQTKIDEAKQANPELKTGYFVGINSEGNFIFEVSGTDKGLIEVLGLHQYAAERIRQIVDNNTGSGDKLVTQVGAIVLELNTKLDTLLQALLPPQNKI